jgi:hypothetical protein
VGTFAGSFEPQRLQRLREAVDQARAAGDVEIATPLDGATESFEAGGHSARMGSNERPTGPWRVLVEAVRGVLDTELVEAPLAAVELAATSREAALAGAGPATMEINLATVAVRTVRLDADGRVLGRWQARLLPAADEDSGPSPAGWTTAAAGWRQPLPFAHGLELAPGDWLQVWVFARLRDVAGDGAERDARLFLAVPG